MNLHYWQYFITLEADLAAIARYVEPHESNMSCYSIEFARLLLAAGSEVDVLCKILCDAHNLAPRPKNIKGYREAITLKFPQFTKLEIIMPRYAMARFPWSSWEDGDSPDWWETYNEVKHDRHNKFQSASLSNAIDAMAGLFVLVSYVCHVELRARTALPWPQMLTLDPQLSSYIRTNLTPGHILPDFNHP